MSKSAPMPVLLQPVPPLKKLRAVRAVRNSNDPPTVKGDDVNHAIALIWKSTTPIIYELRKLQRRMAYRLRRDQDLVDAVIALKMGEDEHDHYRIAIALRKLLVQQEGGQLRLLLQGLV